MLFHQALWKPKGELVGEKPDANHPMTLKLPSIDCVSSFHLGFFRDWLSMDNPIHRAVQVWCHVLCLWLLQQLGVRIPQLVHWSNPDPVHNCMACLIGWLWVSCWSRSEGKLPPFRGIGGVPNTSKVLSQGFLYSTVERRFTAWSWTSDYIYIYIYLIPKRDTAHQRSLDNLSSKHLQV